MYWFHKFFSTENMKSFLISSFLLSCSFSLLDMYILLILREFLNKLGDYIIKHFSPSSEVCKWELLKEKQWLWSSSTKYKFFTNVILVLDYSKFNFSLRASRMTWNLLFLLRKLHIICAAFSWWSSITRVYPYSFEFGV